MKKSTTNIIIVVLLLLIQYFGVNDIFSQNDKALPAPINTAKFTEYAPSVSADGKILIFESDRQGDWKLFESSHNGKNWSVPTPIPKITTTFFEKAPLGGPCLSYDGNLLFFSANGKDSDGHEDIYYSVREKSEWSAPMNLGKPVNSVDYEGYPSLSADGKYLYFARAKYTFGDKKNAQQHCYRIMRAERGANGKWQDAIELPSPVNLICEKAPRIMPDGKTLVFSSIRKDGQGNFDIYKCKWQANGSWTEPAALDFLNTSESDQFVAMPAYGEVMYYVRNGDIYTATVPVETLATIQGYVTDSISNNVLPAKILVSEIGNPVKIITESMSDALDGRIIKLAPISSNFIVKAFDAGTNELLKDTKVTITEIASIQIAEVKANTETGECGTNLLTGKQYKIVVSSEFCEDDEQTITKNEDLKNLLVKLIPKKVFTVNFTAFNGETSEPIDGDFTVTSEKTGKVFKELNVKAKEVFSVRLSKNDNLKLEVVSDGFATARKLIEITDLVLGDRRDYKVKLVIDQYPLTIKVVDAETQKPIKEAIVKISEMKTSEVKQLTKNKTNDFTANLKRSGFYKLNIKAEDYVELSEQKIDKAPEGGIINFMLLKKKRLPVNFAVFDVSTNKPLAATFSVRLEKEQKTFSFKDEVNGTVKVAEKEVFTVETSAEGYKLKQSTFNMADFSIDKKHTFNIGLEKALFVLNIKATNGVTNQAVLIGDYKITDLTSKINKTDIIKLPTGDATVSLTPNNKYLLEIMAKGFEKFEQELSKLSKNELICPLTPKIQESALVLSNVDSTDGRPLDAVFKVNPSKTAILVQRKTSETTPEYKLPLTEVAHFNLETFVKGHYIKKENVAYTALGKPQKQLVEMSRNFSVLSLKAYDANDNSPVREVSFSFIDTMNDKSVITMITMPDGECNIDLKPGREYLIRAKLAGYDDYESRFTASNNDMSKSIKMRSLRKHDLFLYAKEPIVAKQSSLFDKIEKGMAIILNNVYFEQSSFIIQKESYPELDKVILVLKTNPKTKIEIGGHTDNVGDNRLNLALSENRAKVILNYLVSKGIDEDQLLHRGYGGTKSVASNDIEDNRKKNRRVEIVRIQ